MKWRNPGDENSLTVESHASVWASVIMRRVKIKDGKPEAICIDVLESAMAEAFEAGVRFGSAKTEQGLDTVIRDAVEAALGSVKKGVRATCPDCSGAGCPDCNETGYFDQRGVE